MVEEAARCIRKNEKSLGAFVSLDLAAAARRALELEAQTRRGQPRGILHGVPIGVKDIFDVAGFRTCCGSALFEDEPEALRDSFVASRLRDAGAIIMGKTATHELALGVTTPTTRNPWDLQRSPGGSSGGSAAAVASGMTIASIGSDTGGSVRTPASLCGVVGLKPTYGRISRAGALSLSWSLDHVGVLTRTVQEAAVMLQALSGPDVRDAATLDQPPLRRPRFDVTDLRGRRLGIVDEAFFDGVDTATAGAFVEVTAAAEALGAAVLHISVPPMLHALNAEMVILLSEAAAYHAARLEVARPAIGADVLSLLRSGRRLSATDYLLAQQMRSVLYDAIRQVFLHHGLDAILAPTTPRTAHRPEETSFDWGSRTEDAGDAYVRTAALANLCGLPALALPCALSSAGLPLSVQLVGAPFEEHHLLEMGAALHGATAWGGAWRAASVGETECRTESKILSAPRSASSH